MKKNNNKSYSHLLEIAIFKKVVSGFPQTCLAELLLIKFNIYTITVKIILRALETADAFKR